MSKMPAGGATVPAMRAKSSNPGDMLREQRPSGVFAFDYTSPQAPSGRT